MVTIKYKMTSGRIEDIEVTDEIAAAFAQLEKEGRRNHYKETRRHLSLDMLIEIEERESQRGSLESQSLKRNQEVFSLVSPELDPLEVLMQREQESEKPIVKALSLRLGLTDYQKKIAAEHYVNNKTQTQIAKELGITRMAVCNVLKKVKKKVLDKFIKK